MSFGIVNKLKRSMIAGALVLVPLIMTFWVLKVIISSVDEFVVGILPSRFNPEILSGYDIPGIGLVITVVILILTGFFTRLYLVKKLVKLGDRLMDKVPVGRGIYSVFKKFFSTIFNQDSNRFKEVVMFEFPRHGVWMMGFVTGELQSSMANRFQEKMLNVFVPTTPNPTTGFFIMVAEKDLTVIPISVDDAFKMIISGGIVQSEE